MEQRKQLSELLYLKTSWTVPCEGPGFQVCVSKGWSAKKEKRPKLTQTLCAKDGHRHRDLPGLAGCTVPAADGGQAPSRSETSWPLSDPPTSGHSRRWADAPLDRPASPIPWHQGPQVGMGQMGLPKKLNPSYPTGPHVRASLMS